MEVNDTKKFVLENLKDAGCDEKLIEQILNLFKTDCLDDALTLLSKHRKAVLESYHIEQKKLDCIDYFVYQIKKEIKS